MKKVPPAKGLLKGLAKRLGLDSTIRTAKQIDSQVAQAAAKTSQIKRKALQAGDARRAHPVSPGQVGSYRELKRQEIPGDRMAHDHIPSSAALKERADQIAQEKLGRKLTKQERAELHRQAQTIEVHQDLHAKISRTYGSRNTRSQIAQDAGDLPAAIEHDIASYTEFFKKEGWTDAQIHDVFDPVRQASHEFLSGDWWNPFDVKPETGS